MNPTRGFACINELDFGVPLKAAMSAIFRLKLSGATYRTVVLEAHRFDGTAALESGIVDAVGGLDEALGLIASRKLVEKPRTGIYGLMKTEMYRESVALLSEEGHLCEEERVGAILDAEEERKEKGRKRVEEIKEKAKL